MLETFKSLDKQGIDLRYFDESGFCLVPYIPYAWQQKGATIEIETTKSRRLNVLGFLNRENELQAYTFEGSVNSDVVIACIDDFSFALTKRTVLVIDNAKVHKYLDKITSLFFNYLLLVILRSAAKPVPSRSRTSLAAISSTTRFFPSVPLRLRMTVIELNLSTS